MPGVEEEVAYGRGADHRRAIGGQRAKPGPELGLGLLARFREQRHGAAQDRVGPDRIDVGIVAVELRRAGDAQAVAQAAVNQLMGVIGDRHGRRLGLARDRQGHRITLGRIDRDPDAEGAQVKRAVAAERDDVMIGGEHAALGHDAGDPPGHLRYPPDRCAETEDDAHLGAHLGQAGGEFVGIAADIAGAVDAADDPVPGRRQGGLERDATGAVEDRDLASHLAHHRRPLGAVGELPVIAEDMEDAPALLVVFEPGLRRQLLEHGAAVKGEGQDTADVGARPPRRAVGEEAEPPGPHGGIGVEMKDQRRVLAPEPSEELQGHGRVGPGHGVGGRDMAAIGVAGLETRPPLAVDDGDLVPGAGEEVGRAHADHTGAEYQYLRHRLP